MATSKKLTGALSLTSPTDNEIEKYNSQMSNLMGELIQTPEQKERDELLAWGGGLSDPSGNGNLGGALVNATKAQGEMRLKNRELAGTYIPMIMNALSAQQQANQLARVTANLGTAGGVDFKTMTPEQLAQYNLATGKDHTKIWELTQFGKDAPAGSWQMMPNGQPPLYRPDPKIGLDWDPQTQSWARAPGSENLAVLEGQKSEAQTRGANIGRTVKRVTPGGVEYEQLFPEAFPGSGPQAPPAVPPRAQAQGAGPVAPPVGGSGPGMGVAPPPMARPAQPPVVGQGGALPGPIQAQVNNALAPGAMPPAEPVTAGSFKDKPVSQTMLDIANLKDPQQRSNALQSFSLQLGGHPPGTGGVGGGVQGSPSAVTAPSQDTGLPPGAVQTGVDPRVKLSNKTIEEANTLFLGKDGDYAKALADGRAASTSLAAINQSRKALAALNTGAGGEFVAAASNVLGALGVEKAREYAGNSQIFQQAANDKLLAKLETQIGVQTEGDATRAKSTFASLKNTPKANAFILDMAQAIAERDQKKAEYFAKALPLAQKQGDLQEINRRWMQLAPSIWKMPSMRRWDTE